MSEERKIRNDIVAVGLLAGIIFLVASLATYDPTDPAHKASALLNNIYQPDQLTYPATSDFNNACGRIGAWTSDLLINTLGIGAYFLLIGLIAMEIALFKRQSVDAPWLKTIGWAVSLFALTTLATMIIPSGFMSPLIGPGGYVGALGQGILGSQLGATGSLITAVTLFFAGMMMWTEYLVFKTGRVVFAPALVAATAVLPFGLLHNFVNWFNGTESTSGLADDDIENFDTDLAEEEEDEEEQPRTIRFKRRDVDEDGNEIDEDAESDEEDEDEAVAEADEDEYEDDDEIEDEQYESIEEPAATLKISSTAKEPDPTEEEEIPAVAASIIPKPHFKMPKKEKVQPPSEREIVMNQLNAAAAIDESVEYELPRIEMLAKGAAVPFEKQKREALNKADILEKTCKEFGYDVKVVEIEPGPVITQYEIELAPGLRLQKITALADDLAIAMRVPSVRIVAPIPGKNSVGVEIPNETRQTVLLREVMEQSTKQYNKMKIPLFLGADAVGKPMVADLASLPHLLIAGRTGTGKSVALNAIITSILMTRRPDEVRMLMIDPKMVELSGYARLPHLMHPVVTDMRKAEAILAWACDKMDERYTLLAKAGVRHVTSYNQLSEEELLDRLQPENDEERAKIPSSMPFIVIVADEMADLMMTAGKDVEQHIIRLAQKSRAVGIHLINTKKKPTVDVITGLIKSNLPARISFQVASKTDSRVVLDAQGADKLLGMGDMLFLWPGTSTLLRGQGTYVADSEIDMITDTVSTGEQNFVHELVNIKLKSEEEEEESDEPKKLENRDELYEQAIGVIVEAQRGSCSLLQRAMGIGYGRAARLIDFMAEDGYVGPYNGSKAREVMLSTEQWANIQAGDPNPVNDEDWPEEGEAEEAVSEPVSVAEKKVAKPVSPKKSEQQQKLKSIVKAKPKTEEEPEKVELKIKKLVRIEPGQASVLSANTSFAPKRKFRKTEDEAPADDELEEDEEELEDEDNVEMSGEYEDVDDEDADEEYEDYDDADYDEEEEEEEEEYEDEDEYEEDDGEYEDVE
ncbi:MAG: DNA translocase FtsK [Mariniblastus sp.]